MDNLIKCQKNYTISFEFWIQIMVYKIIYVLDMNTDVLFPILY